MIWAIVGSNDFVRQQKLKQLTADFVEAHGDVALERLDGESVTVERLSEALTSLPFLAAKKMVVVKKLSTNKAASEAIEAMLQALPDSTDLVIVEPKVDKRSVYYKLLKKQKNFVECEDLDQVSLGRWVMDRVREKGGTISLADANHLVSRLGGSQMLAASEIDKLLLHDLVITRENIDLLTEPTPQSTVFELLGAAFEGRAQTALAIYEEQRRLRVEPQAILALVAWQLHLLSLIKAAKGRGSAEIAKAGGVSPYAVGRSMGIARQISVQDLRRLVHETLVLDARLKSEALDTDGAMKNLILKIATA